MFYLAQILGVIALVFLLVSFQIGSLSNSVGKGL